MTLKSLLLATSVALFGLHTAAQAHDALTVTDAYARASTPNSASGAAFMVIENHTATDDRLLSVASTIAQRVELHTHKQDANGVMQMIAVPEGFAIPAGASHALQRGGDHVMLLGLTAPLEQGDEIDFTMTFEHGGEIKVKVPVDLNRDTAAPTMPGVMMDHGAMEGGMMGHGAMKHGTAGN